MVVEPLSDNLSPGFRFGLAVVGEERGVHCWMALGEVAEEELRGHCLRVLKVEEGAEVAVHCWTVLGVGVAEE